MSLFGKILNSLGIKKEDETVKKVQAEIQKAERSAEHAARIARIRAMRAEEKVRQLFAVDVMGKLEKMAEENPSELNWKTSIVDLLKLLGIDSSYENRRELAVELGIPQEKLEDSAEMNTWLHKAVMIELAEHGGNVPAELLD